MTPADRERIAELLDDDSLSFRAIARATGYSDHTIRRISRELTNDPRPMRSPPPPRSSNASSAAGWIVAGGVVFVALALVWFRVRWAPES
jgi:hypothetical protein